jgi:uncharacterized protein (TIGR03437 family)
VGAEDAIPEEEKMRIRQLVITICAGSLPLALAAQVPNASLLKVEIQNHRIYLFDVPPSEVGKSSVAMPLAASAPGTFYSWVGIGDIVAVNGTPVKGTVFERSMTLNARPNATAGGAIADVSGAGLYEWNLEFLNTDGTSLGRILVQGMAGGGPAPPGAPSLIPRADYMVVGGTGVFLGVRGGYFVNNPTTAIPLVSAAEDPSNRRVFGGGNAESLLYLIPQSAPQIVETPNGPAVTHSNDFTVVTPDKPAAPGEVLSLYATGLGPTRPGVEPGKTFPMEGSAAVAGPVAVLVNGKPAEVLAAVGYPGSTDGYQVNFRIPPDATSGQASIQVSAAWMTGPQSKITIR